MDVTFLLCDLVTGLVLTELPLDPGGNLKRTICRVEQQSFTLPVLDDATPDDWGLLLVPGRTMVVLVLDSTPANAWVVLEVATGTATVPVNASTLEECLVRTNVPTLDSLGVDDDSLTAAELVADLSPRFGFDIEWTPCGKSGDHIYSELEDRTVLDAVNELMAAEGGPEWHIVLRWVDDTRRAVQKVIEIGPRIGHDRPDAIFDLDADGAGSIDTYQRTSSFAAGKGATMVIGTSEGSGESRPMSAPMVSLLVAAGWPLWEERVNYTGLDAGTTVDEDTELAARTAKTLAQREVGAVTWAITGAEGAPAPGRDYAEGDTVHLAVAPQGKLDPYGGIAAVRVLGWELDPTSGRSTPTVWDDQSEAADG